MPFARIRTFLERPVFVSAVLAGLISLISLIPNAWSAGFGSLRLSYIQGDVQVRTGDTQDWVAAATNIPLADGDNIWSPEGATAEVQVLNGTCVRVDGNTSLSVVTSGKNTYQFSLDQGNAYINAQGGKNDLFQFDTPSASVRVIGKAIFEVDVSTEGYADVSVLAGSLSVETASGGLTVSRGQVVSIKQDGAPQLFALSAPDDWTRWNQDRDRMIYQHRASARYLPGDLQTYSADFDQNGRWTYAPDYGNVWIPTAVVGATWSPYREGRWCWMGGDYVWVPYESWGWCPYHYGRWAIIGSLGWCWVPPPPRAVYWAPAYVGWVHTADRVAWVPLAPGEIYYGRGYHGPNSVNITKININNTVINKPYRNVNAHNGVVAATRETFLTGRGEHMRSGENPFLTHRATVGPPPIKPERQTFMPSLKTIPRTERPPEHLTTVIPRGMEKPLPAERRLDRSVIRPAQPQQQLPAQRPAEAGPGAGTRQRAERGSQPVPERGPSVERPLRQAPFARPEAGPAPARPAPAESPQKPAQPGAAPRAAQPVAPGAQRPQRAPTQQPQAAPKATRPEVTPPARPEVTPGPAQSTSPAPARPERPGTIVPSARPTSPPPARQSTPEARPVAPPAPTRPQAPEVRPVPPPPPAVARPPQAPPAPVPREQVRQSAPEARPVAPRAPTRPQAPEVRPVPPPVPPRPSTPAARPVAPPPARPPASEVRPVAPPPPAVARPPQAPPAPPAPARPPQAPPAPAPQAKPATPPAAPPAATHPPAPAEHALTPAEHAPPTK